MHTNPSTRLVRFMRLILDGCDQLIKAKRPTFSCQVIESAVWTDKLSSAGPADGVDLRMVIAHLEGPITRNGPIMNKSGELTRLLEYRTNKH